MSEKDVLSVQTQMGAHNEREIAHGGLWLYGYMAIGYALVAINGMDDIVEDTADRVSFFGERLQSSSDLVLFVVCSLDEGRGVNSVWQISTV